MCPGNTLKWCCSLTAALEVVQKYSRNVVFLLGRNDSRWRGSRTQKPLEITFLAFLLIIYAWWVDSPVWARREPTGRMSDWLEIWLFWQQAAFAKQEQGNAVKVDHQRYLVDIIGKCIIYWSYWSYSSHFVHKLKGFHNFILVSF